MVLCEISSNFGFEALVEVELFVVFVVLGFDQSFQFPSVLFIDVGNLDGIVIVDVLLEFSRLDLEGDHRLLHIVFDGHLVNLEVEGIVRP